MLYKLKGSESQKRATFDVKKWQITDINLFKDLRSCIPLDYAHK